MNRTEFIELYLRDLWRSLRDDANPFAVRAINEAINAAHVCGALSLDAAELWRRRITTCPGHDDEGGRSWCAYCGALRAAGVEVEDDAGVSGK